jgi:hypothetical protein
MKKTIIISIGIVLSVNIFSQTISKISTFYNTYNDNSGIIGITDSGIYEYSWYYDQWLSFPTEGLAVVGGHVKVNEVSACDNGSHNPSGVYVISDTAVHVYNYYAEFWYALHNEGLEKDGDIVLLSDLSVNYDIEDDEVYVYVKSGDHVYYYGWYSQQWFQLTNDGLTDKETITSTSEDFSIYPNPIVPTSKIKLRLPDNYNSSLNIAIFSEDGKLVKEIYLDKITGGLHELELNSEEFKSGLYLYEVSGLNFSQVKKFIKFE